MLINSRALALLLAILISVITTAFLSLVDEALNVALVICFLLSFSSSYILIRICLEFLFFRQIKEIHDALQDIRSQDLSFITKGTGISASLNPLKRINKEIFNYAEKKQAEISELKRMEAFRREFIADVSHELKTPIFAAQGFVHTLLDGAVKDKSVRKKFLRKAARSLDGLDILVQDLLTISQLETGEIKMHFEHFDICELCREVFDQLEGKAEKSKITMEIDHPEDQPMFVFADYRRIYQVLINLVSNGIKYTKSGGHVSVKFVEEKGRIKTLVIDNGRGIPKEDISRIFERFYRVDKSRSKEKGGTGLGLSIVKHILEGHSTTIEVESKLKEGSVFSFTLKKGKAVEHRFIDDEEE